MENGVVLYSVEIYGDDDLKNWPPVSSFVALNVVWFLPIIRLTLKVIILLTWIYIYFDYVHETFVV